MLAHMHQYCTHVYIANKNIFKNHVSILAMHFRKPNQKHLANKTHIQKSHQQRKTFLRTIQAFYLEHFRKQNQ